MANLAIEGNAHGMARARRHDKRSDPDWPQRIDMPGRDFA
jgi:hypothetical protein